MRNSRVIFILGFVVAVFCTSIRAQEFDLPVGTEVPLLLSKDVSSKTAQRGDAINFTVEKDVAVNGQVVIKQGAEAKGSVIYAEKGGSLGHSGKLAIQVESTITIDGQPLPLIAAKGGEGDSAGRKTMIFSPVGAFIKGGDTIFKQGMQVTVYTAEARRFKVDGSSLSVVKLDETSINTSTDVATVYIFRQKSMFGAAMEPSVFCDDVELARMDNGRYFILKIPAGKRLIHLTDKKKGYEINMAKGQTYYFRIGIEVGMWKGNGKILLEDNEKGATEVKKIKYLGADKIKDKTIVQPIPTN